MPFKWTITHGVDMLLSKMDEVSLERHSGTNKSLRFGAMLEYLEAAQPPKFFIMKDTLGG